ncbi:MAG: transcription antitermination factor NusB [Desulfatiglans sp.]|jgi:transcription antitermination factor NusB|nr:transcription antitermination factor NusB [Thermodesulfobacteriota bacterium]MEE4352015.1 transcription antitermination factor NusB [Desulfatiglans sp.]
MGERRRSRELALQVLFHLEFNEDDPDEVFELICENFKSKKSARPFSKKLVLGVVDRKDELDRLITQASRNWRLERMSCLDKCILRMAILEMAFMEDIPPKVSIDEAVELGKVFGSEYSSSFINGILDKVYSLCREEKSE